MIKLAFSIFLDSLLQISVCDIKYYLTNYFTPVVTELTHVTERTLLYRRARKIEIKAKALTEQRISYKNAVSIRTTVTRNLLCPMDNILDTKSNVMKISGKFISHTRIPFYPSDHINTV